MIQVRAIKRCDGRFSNWESETYDRWNYQDYLKDEKWRKEWISFDCLLWNPDDDLVYCGITSFNNDIFAAYDRKTDSFVELGYERVADKYDAKFHRGLERDQESGRLYGAVALLHDIDQYWDAPGGAIIEYDPKSGAIEKIGIPVPHNYIQSIILDQKSKMLYGQCFTPERFFSFDLKTRQAKDLGPLSCGYAMAQGQIPAQDDNGVVWASWTVTRAWQMEPGVDMFRLCRFDPKVGKLEYLKTGVPRADRKYGTVPAEAFFNLGTGCIYISADEGALYKLDPVTAKVEFLFRPIQYGPSRLASLRLGPDGMAYGVVGVGFNTQLMRFDPKDDSYELLGKVYDESIGERAYQIHDVAITDDLVVYAGENDNEGRSSYLWECKL